MTMQVLKCKSEITYARFLLARLGMDLADGRVRSFMKRLHLHPGHRLGDRIKSWDVFKSADFILERLDRDDPVLDIGAYASEILPALSQKGFTRLAGIDLNPDIKKMPYAGKIDYHTGDFYCGTFSDKSFSAITAISVIEHGYAPQRLLPEISRLLRPGGYFIASVDYWPDKIDTRGVKAFGLDWIIFSRSEIQELFDQASRFGLNPVGDIDFEAGDPLIDWQGKNYTFAWFVLKKE